jgi:hypothetical protein
MHRTSDANLCVTRNTTGLRLLHGVSRLNSERRPRHACVSACVEQEGQRSKGYKGKRKMDAGRLSVSGLSAGCCLLLAAVGFIHPG